MQRMAASCMQGNCILLSMPFPQLSCLVQPLPLAPCLLLPALLLPSYCLQDVDAVVDTCHAAGISKKVVRLRPIAVIKG
jgi:hypothetical protein